MLGTSGRTGPRPPPTANIDVLERQLQSGDVQVNATVMSREELIEWAKKLKDSAHRVKSLRILCVPRGIMWSQYHYSQMQRHTAGQHIFSTPEHKMGVKIASANVQHHLVRMAFYKAVCAVVRRGALEELVLGLRFSESGCTTLSDALAVNTTLKRLSFAGSHMGDERVMWLKPGLTANNSLEELDLTACFLSDEAARSVASVIKAHVDRRLALVFDEQLRHYPDSSLPSHKAHLQYHAQLRAIARNVDQTCGGLLHLELAENRLTDQAVRALCTALSYDRRLIFLSLRANMLTAAAEAELIALMKEHQALLRVDLRQNADPKLGILKLKRRAAPRVFSAALGFQPNPAAPGLLSPARTNTSMPLWALREEISDSLGPTPMATPRPVAPNSPGRMSTVSWGDLHLLVRGSPDQTGGAGPGGARGRRGGAGGGTGARAGAGSQRARSGGDRRPGNGGDSGAGSGAPPSPRGRQDGQQQHQQQPQQPQQAQGQVPLDRREQLWANREVTLSGEPAAAPPVGNVGGGPGASGVYDTPQRRTGAGDSDFVLQASGPDAAAAAAAAAASLVTGIPVPLSSGSDSFGFGAVGASGAPGVPRGPPQAAAQGPGLVGSGASWVAPPSAVNPWQQRAGPSDPVFASGIASPVSARVERPADRQPGPMGPPGVYGVGHGAGGFGPMPGQPTPLGRSPLSRVTGPLTRPAGGSVTGSDVNGEGSAGDDDDRGGGSAGGSGGGGVPWVWGRPVNPDGSDMVVLVPTASPPRQRSSAGGVVGPATGIGMDAPAPPAPFAGPQAMMPPQLQQPQAAVAVRPQPASPLRPRPYPSPAPSGRNSARGSQAGAGPQPSVLVPPPPPQQQQQLMQPQQQPPPPAPTQPPVQPTSGWVNLPDGGGLAWRATPVPIVGMDSSPAAQRSPPTQPVQPPEALYRRWPPPNGGMQATQPYGPGALPAGPAPGSAHVGGYREVGPPTGLWSRSGTGDGAAAPFEPGPAALGGGGDSALQAVAFNSMLHREGLARGQGSYDYLFAARQRHQRSGGMAPPPPHAQANRRRGASPRKAPRSPSRTVRRSGGGRAGVKRRQPSSTPKPGGRRATRSVSRSPPRSPPRSRSRSRATLRSRPASRRTSASPSPATPTRHRTTTRRRTTTSTASASPGAARTPSGTRRTPGRGGGGGGGTRAGGTGAGSVVVRKKTPGRNGLAFRTGRRVKAKRTRGSGSAKKKKKDGRGRKATSSPRRSPGRGRTGGSPRGDPSDTDPEALAALEWSLLQMAEEVSALEAAAAASRAAAAAAAAEHEKDEHTAAVDAAATAAERAAVAAEAAQRAAVTAADHAAAAQRTAKDAVRRVKKVVAAVKPSRPSRPQGTTTTAAAGGGGFGTVAVGTTTEPSDLEGARGHGASAPLVVQLQPHPIVRQYDGSARGNGVNVNTIIEQLDRWCGLCDDALLQPPSTQSHDGQQPQQLQPPPRVQSPLRSLQARLQAAPPDAHPQPHPQLQATQHPAANLPAKVQLPCASGSRSRSPQRR